MDEPHLYARAPRKRGRKPGYSLWDSVGMEKILDFTRNGMSMRFIARSYQRSSTSLVRWLQADRTARWDAYVATRDENQKVILAEALATGDRAHAAELQVRQAQQRYAARKAAGEV